MGKRPGAEVISGTTAAGYVVKRPHLVNCLPQGHKSWLSLVWGLSSMVCLVAPCFGGVETNQVREVVRGVPSLYLSTEEKEAVAIGFIELVQIASPSGKEDAIRENVRSKLLRLGARDVLSEEPGHRGPRNLVMEFPGAGAFGDKPGFLLNAHLDTIPSATHEQMCFDARRGDFYHRNEGSANGGSSFGADDKAGVAAILGCISALRGRSNAETAGFRRLVVAFTAREERGCEGARDLSKHYPEVFRELEFALTLDGPLDYASEYPRFSFVVVVSEPDLRQPAYSHLARLVTEVAWRKQTDFWRTEVGLGMGDFAWFPPEARSGLHLRSPYRGFHSHERVSLQDLINHVDLLCHILERWDEAPETRRAVAARLKLH